MRHPPQDKIPHQQERASSGIAGFDQILGGGFPALGGVAVFELVTERAVRIKPRRVVFAESGA